MPNSIKDQVTDDLKKAKEEGKLRVERIREIVQSAVSQAVSEFKGGSREIRPAIKDAVSAVIDSLQEKGKEIKEEVTASIEGAIEGISRSRRQAIAKDQAEVEQLQAKIDTEEQELQEQIDSALTEIEETGKDQSASTKASIESAIDAINNSEEVALMQKRYAQLKAQLAILQANLAARYGESYEEAKKHLDDAQTWYERTQDRAEVVADNVKQKRAEFEEKLDEAGTALAKRERRVRLVLKELWQSATEALREK